MKKLIVANWKELPGTPGEAEGIIEKLDGFLRERPDVAAHVDLVICPPFTYLEKISELLSEGALADVAHVGAQDTHDHLAKLGVRYVIVGHSSRRAEGETDAMVNEKLKSVLQASMVPVVCVEDPEQARATFAGLSDADVARCLIAYEPVWAISTNLGGHPDTPDNAAEAVARIREAIGGQRFLYGGSITDANAAAFLSRPEFSGVLIGGASVRAEEFCRILSIAAQRS